MKYWIIYTQDNKHPEVLAILKRRTLEGANFTASLVHKTNFKGEKQQFDISWTFQD
ncbi:hypothetical protein SAMN05443253_103246 [Bacillus sp. OK048]|nr:hypothetical protein SAMN05443253_103246 [Bacillus sp. OK048]